MCFDGHASEPMMIRLARPSDLPALRAIERSVAEMYRGTRMDFPANSSPNHRGDLMTAIERKLMWVAEVDARVVGFLFAEPAVAGLYLRELAVAVSAQRKGIGRALMAAGVSAARSRGDKIVVLTTDRALPWNAPFYARLGFDIVEGDAIPMEARRRLAGQIAAGFDPSFRCAMTLELS